MSETMFFPSLPARSDLPFWTDSADKAEAAAAVRDKVKLAVVIGEADQGMMSFSYMLNNDAPRLPPIKLKET